MKLPSGMSPMPNAAPDRYGCSASARSTMASSLPHSASATSTAAMSRCSAGVRTMLQNTTRKGAARDEVVQSIHLSASAR